MYCTGKVEHLHQNVSEVFRSWKCAHLGGKCVLFREVVSLVQGVLDYIGCECICAQCIHYLENACCELALQDSLYQ